MALGPVALLEQIGEGAAACYRRRPLAEIEKALKLAYGDASVPDLVRALTGLEAAARALNRRRLFDAAVAARETRLQPLSPQAVTKLLAATGLGQVPLAKAFNPDQPRVPAGNPGGGQWAGGDDVRTAPRGIQIADNNLVASDAPSSSRNSNHYGDLTAERGTAIVSHAASWDKVPYAPKGTENAGAKADPKVAADCSGSVHAIYGQAGYDYVYQQTANFAAAAANGTIPFRKLGPSEAPQPGDVVFYPSGHMSIYTGDGTVWSA